MSIFGKNTPPENENYEQKKLEMAREMCEKIKTEKDTIVLTKCDFFAKCGDAAVQASMRMMMLHGMPDVVATMVMSAFTTELTAALFGKVVS